MAANGAKFLGSHTVERLQGRGCLGPCHSLQPRVSYPGVEYVEANLRSSKMCAEFTRNITTSFWPRRTPREMAIIREQSLAHDAPNVATITFLIDAAYRLGVKRLLFLSPAARPNTGNRPAALYEILSGELIDVYYAIAWIKRYAKILYFATKIRNSTSCIVVGPSNGCGPVDKSNFKVSHVAATLISRAVERKNPIASFHVAELHVESNILSGIAVAVCDMLETTITVDRFASVDVNDPSKPSTMPVRWLSNVLEMGKLESPHRRICAPARSRTGSRYRTNL